MTIAEHFVAIETGIFFYLIGNDQNSRKGSDCGGITETQTWLPCECSVGV